MIYLVNKYEPIVIALSETWLSCNINFKISGYNTVREDRADGYGGVAILINNCIPYNQISLPTHSDDFSIVAISVNNVCIVSVYIAYPTSSIFREIKNIIPLLPKPFLLLGDFNSQHQSWGSSISNSWGEELIEIIDLYNLCILNNGSPTRFTEPSQNTSVVDLSICTPNLACSLNWHTLPSTHGSDHYPIIISLPCHKFKKYCRVSTRKFRVPEKSSSHWQRFKNIVHSKISNLPTIASGNEDICSNALVSILTDAAREVFPEKDKTPYKIPSPPWWDKNCSDIIKRRKAAEVNYKINMSSTNYQALVDINLEVKKLFKRKKFEGWRRFCESISPDTHPTIVWTNIKKFKCAFNVSTNNLIPPSLASEFADILAPPWVPSPNIQCFDSYFSEKPSTLSSPFSLQELKGIVKDRKDSAPGGDGISYLFLENCTDETLSYYLHLINSVMLTGNIPQSWKSHVVLPVLKPNKNPSEVSSFRPIALSSVLLKLAEYLIKNRLEWHLESNTLLASSQFGFRKGKGTMDNISILITDVRLAFTFKESVIAAFLDVSSAYDNVILSVLTSKLYKLKVPNILINFIYNILSDRQLILSPCSDFQIKRCVNKGLPQGSVLSPLLYNVYTYDLDFSIGNNVKVLQYADDLLLYSINKSIDTASVNLSSALINLKEWMNCNGLDLSAHKSSIVLFTRMRIPPSLEIFYDNIKIPIVTQCKFLGVILDSKLSGKAHCDFVVSKCERLLNMMRCLSGVWWGAHPLSLKLVYNALIRSVLDYGTFLLQPGNIGSLKKLDIVQSKALRIITGSMKSSPINALQVECCEPPLHLRRQFLADRFLFRCLQFNKHPLFALLHSLSEEIETSNYWTHKSLPCLIVSYNKYRSLQSPIHRSNCLPLFNCSLDSLLLAPVIHFNLYDKTEPNPIGSFKNKIDLEYNNYHQIYTDASKPTVSDCVGVGVYDLQSSIVQKIKLPPETSVFTGECFGLFKAIEYVHLMKLKYSLILSDSLSALQALSKFPFQLKTHLPIIFDIRSWLYKCKMRGCTIVFAWIPGHCNIEGNDVSDQLAKEAVHSGDLFPYKNYCQDLLALPKVFMMDAWNALWIESRALKGKYYSGIQTIIPKEPWYRKAKFGKIATSMIIRMRLGHVCSTAHLARLGIVTDPTCECGLDIGTVDHIFFNCHRFDRSSFLSDLISLNIPFPTCIATLLATNNLSVYTCIVSFISLNNIKL